METENRKPVPDVEALRYRGIPEKPDIKIFVSHRIDLDSETIDNPLYIPVRCGAVYDEREDIEMLGDDTGDNISEKRMSYCELTVQYWAWKNVKADYYGLCHYRRYIGFGDEHFPVGKKEANNGCVVESALSSDYLEKHQLSEEKMREVIGEYDVVAIEPIKLSGATNYSSMKNSPDYHNMDDVDLAIDIVEKKYPNMIHAVEKYMRHSEDCWLYNCWIMKADIFEAYSKWLFEILAEVEKRVNDDHYSMQMYRTPGTLSERLFGIYLTYLQEKKVKIKYQQLVFVTDTSCALELKPFFKTNNIAITSNFDNNYAPIFSVLLESILRYASENCNYDVIVLSRDISEHNQKILKKQIDGIRNFSIRFVNPERYLQKIDLYVGNTVYTEDMYVRVLIPHILPDYEKILVVDADMIFKTDIASLYLTELEDYWAAAVKDTVYQGYLNGVVPDTLDYAKKVLKLQEPYNYCNTGVIIFNCKQYRTEYSLPYLQNYIHTHHYRIYEQDTLNVLLQGHIKFLDHRWNMYTYTSKLIEKCVKFSPLSEYNLYVEARKNPGCLHYAAHPKPWWNGEGDFANDFWDCARKSPFYEKILYGMMKYAAQQSGAQVVVTEPASTYTYKSFPRKVADIVLPKGSRRRNLLKKVMPKDSPQWNFFKKIYNRIAHIS